MPKKEEIIIQDRYKVISALGRGGMGAVYLCEDLRLNCHVALKRMLSTQEFSSNRFQREAILLANLQHENLPKVTDYFSENDRHYLVMEYIDGADLQELIEKHDKPFAVTEIEDWVLRLAKVISYLHGQNPPILHRDIKPSNIKINKRGKLFLLDFGLAHGKAGLMQTQMSLDAVGFTPVFASIEQIQGEQTTKQSDIFSLGATLYYLLTNTQPSNALFRAAAIAKGQPDPLIPLKVSELGVTENIAHVIHQCMALDPRKRPENIQEFYSKWKDVKDKPIILRSPDKKPTITKKKVIVFGITSILIILLMVFLLKHKAVGQPQAGEQDETVTFNYKSKVYHCVNCEWAIRCTKSCKNVPMSEAIKKGGRPCKTCQGTCR